MIRLRSGYAGIGFFTHFDNAVLPCPKCGGYDSIRHMLLDCNAYQVERTRLFEKVAAVTNGEVEVMLPILLGFHYRFLVSSYVSSKLREITSATGQFVLTIGRHI